jgi:hypothetical protein
MRSPTVKPKLINMHYQRSCPICRSESLQRVLRSAAFSVDLGGEVNPLQGVTSYRCPKGHVFLVLPDVTPAPSRKCIAPLSFIDMFSYR